MSTVAQTYRTKTRNISECDRVVLDGVTLDRKQLEGAGVCTDEKGCGQGLAYAGEVVPGDDYR
jgi:hypothetical protein